MKGTILLSLGNQDIKQAAESVEELGGNSEEKTSHKLNGNHNE